MARPPACPAALADPPREPPACGTMEPFALSVLLALAIAVLLSRPGVFAPALVFESAARQPTPPSVPGDDEEQLPETDRAPGNWLLWTVLAVAFVRVALLVTLRA